MVNFSGTANPPVNENSFPSENNNLKSKTAYQKFLSTTYKIVKISFVSVASVVLFVANPAFFMAGLIPSFVACVVFPEQINKVLERVSKVWEMLYIPIFLAAGLGVFAGWPVVIAGGSFLAGAYVSMKAVAYCCKGELRA